MPVDRGAGGRGEAYIYIYICISAGPCLSGATRLRSNVNNYSYQVICTSVVSESAIMGLVVLI